MDEKPPGDNNGVYDDNKPGWRTSPELDDLEKSFGAESASDLPPGHPDAKRAHTQKLAGDALKSMEAGEAGTPAAGSGASDFVGGGYKEDSSRVGKLLAYAQNPAKRRRALIGGGAGGGIVAVLISIFMALIPLKIVGMMDNLRSHFFSTSESAVSKQTDNLFSHYVAKHILPGIKGCKTTYLVNKDCIAPVNGNSNAHKLYQGWKDARLENKLAQDYGITFERKGNSYGMTVPGEDFTPLDDLLEPGNTKTLSDLSRADVRAKYKVALENETFLKKTMYRFKVGKLLERKYGIKRCVVACDTKDKFADWKGKENRAFKTFLADRVLVPNSEAKSLILECVFQGGCDSAESDGADGEKRDKFQKDLAEKLAAHKAEYGEKAVAKIIADSDAILKDGFAKYITTKVVSAVATDATGVAAGEIAEKAVPVIGWIDGGAKLITTAGGAGGKLKKWVFVTNSTAMVSLYQMYRSHADEIKSGHVNADMVGSFTSAMDTNQKKLDDKGTMGGGAAEDSPLYADLFGAKSTGTAALIGGSFSGQAKAATSDPCDDGSPIPAGKLLCPEETLITSNFITSFSAIFAEGQPLHPLLLVAQGEQKTIGWVTGLVGNALGAALEKVPGYQAAVAKVTEMIGPFLKSVTDSLLPSPISDNMSGHRNFDMVAGGADVAANTYAETGIGGQKLTNGQVAEIRNDQERNAQQEFNQQPFFARMFDTKSQYSLVTKMAMAMPTNANASLKSSFADLISNPITKLTRGLAVVMSPGRAFAAEQPADDPFGMPQFGYALNNPVFNTDPETYTDEYCKQLTIAWNAATTVDPNTGMDIHTTTNPCLLNKAATGAAGAMFTDAVLEPGDTNTPTGGNASSSGGAQGQLAPGALSWPVDLKGSNITQCAGMTGAGVIITSGHIGIDISQTTGTPVFASADGKVVFAASTGGISVNYGLNYVVIQHSNGFTTGYGHMNSMSVKEGDSVTQGQQIGTVGSQGKSTGPHLHYNVKKGGWTGWDDNNVDPLTNGLQIPTGIANGAGCHN